MQNGSNSYRNVRFMAVLRSTLDLFVGGDLIVIRNSMIDRLVLGQIPNGNLHGIVIDINLEKHLVVFSAPE